jgi:hypothetical protein
MPDVPLLKSIARGDRYAFEELYRRCYGRLTLRSAGCGHD